MNKPKLALYWAASCGGCDVAVLDINEKILDVAAIADIVLWPIAVDFKYHHVKAMKSDEIDLCLFNGSIRNSEQAEIARTLREKSKVMVAFGACACFGGIPALANLTTRDEIFQRAYLEAPSNANSAGIFPQTSTQVAEGQLDLPTFSDSVSSLAQVVNVEYFVPGCPPPPELIVDVVAAFASASLPPAGAVIASDRALCADCPRKKENKKISRFYRPHEIIPDPEKCLLEQGIICCGPATRGGCGHRCIAANMPCRGCFGPLPGVDQGAALVSAIASIYQGNNAEEAARMVSEIADPAGIFYRFGMSSSMLSKG